jgi:hypothetical protein
VPRLIIPAFFSQGDMMSSEFMGGRALAQNGPAIGLVPVVPHDTADLAQGPCRALYSATAGTITVVDGLGGVATIVSGEAQYHPIRVRRVLATGTTATGLVALY